MIHNGPELGSCGVLAILALVGSCIQASTQTLLALRLPFCGPSVIGHYFCDLRLLLKLACVDTYAIKLQVVSNSGAICTMSFIILLISYVVTLYSLRNHSAKGRRKALSICTSHFIVILLIFHPCMFTYTCPQTAGHGVQQCGPHLQYSQEEFVKVEWWGNQHGTGLDGLRRKEFRHKTHETLPTCFRGRN